MKATDLMIGDLLSLRGEYVIVMGIEPEHYPKRQYAEVLRHKKDGTPEIVRYYVKDMKPIPLTPEILEKNFGKPYPRGGFHNYRMEKDETIAFVIEDRGVSAAPDNRVVFCRVPGTYICDVNYVHELQHALKLCRIEKGIVL